MPRPLQVLIAEDNPTDAELIVHQLRRAGLRPSGSGWKPRQAFAASLRPDLDVILSDYEMPQFSGLRALEVLREHGLEIPFILISGTIGEETAVTAMKKGAADYLLKDRLARLGPAIEHALDQARYRRERRASEIALRESEERFRQVAENIQDVFWLTDLANTADRLCQPGLRKDLGAELRGALRFSPELAGGDSSRGPRPRPGRRRRRNRPTAPTMRNTGSFGRTARCAGFATAPSRCLMPRAG